MACPLRYQETDSIGGKASSRHGHSPGEPRMRVRFCVCRVREGVGGSISFIILRSDSQNITAEHLHFTVIIAGLLRTLAELGVLMMHT